MVAGASLDLFGSGAQAQEQPAGRPLAERLRPAALSEVVGQPHLVGPDGTLTRMLERGALASLILWGPPGVGKTTIARLLAAAAGLHFVSLSAVFSGVADLKRAFEEARRRREAGQRTLLFVDEVHRFNRAQQDGFLPVVEDGTIVLVGATTENPSFALNGALLSRCQVLVLRRLDEAALEQLLTRAEAAAARALPVAPEARASLIAMADGDGRYALNMAEQVLALPQGETLDSAGLAAVIGRRAALYDKDREEHYNLISALHKSLRGSDPDAALYWFARMLAGGEDARYIARRLVRFASEDIGMADPQALVQAMAAWEAYERLGSPEGELMIAQAIVYLGTAPKSNALYAAMGAATRAAKATGSLMPPAHILNAPTELMKNLGYGAGYEYDHDAEEAFSGRNYFPDAMAPQHFYAPRDRGFEREIGKRLEHWARLRAERGGVSAELRAVTPDEAEIRLDRWFRRHFPGVTQGSVQKWCRTGQIRVDGKRAEAATRLAPGQTVRIPPLPMQAPAAATRAIDPAVALELEDWVLYRDEHVIALNKPHGLAVQGGQGVTRHLDGMLDALADAEGRRPKLVHRLDRDTSGVLLLARTPGVAAKLAASFRGRDVRKTYWAVVAGAPEPVEGRIDLPLLRETGPRGERTAPAARDDKEGMRAVTDYRVIDHAGRRLAWVELHPVTGRTHQLRVHCVALGTPIVGDLKYQQPDQNRAFAAIVEGLSNKLHLHARALDIAHPGGGRLVVEAALPKHMRETFKTMGFAHKAAKPAVRQ